MKKKEFRTAAKELHSEKIKKKKSKKKNTETRRPNTNIKRNRKQLHQKES
jgi:hypothetical protein